MCVGDRWNMGSLAHGAMAEYCAIPFFSIYKIADSVSFEEAALLEPLGIAMHGMEKLVRFKPGDDVAVLGCGPIGLFEALLARVGGANKVFITGLAIDKKRLELARDLGFITINAEEHPVRDVIMDMTGGWGVDVVFDATSATGVVFERKVDERVLTFKLENPGGLSEARLMDEETGTLWDAFSGAALEGPLAGAQLERVKSTSSFWFGWKDFYPETEVYGLDE